MKRVTAALRQVIFATSPGVRLIVSSCCKSTRHAGDLPQVIILENSSQTS
jgi:hypothetical protein